MTKQRREILRLRQELSKVDINKPGALKKYDEILESLNEAEQEELGSFKLRLVN